MRVAQLLSIAVSLALAGCLGAPESDGEGGDDEDNLLPNGDFEVGVAGWTTDESTADLADDGPPHDGQKSASICLADVEPLPAAYYLFGTLVAVEAGTYRFTVWARAGEGSSGQLVATTIAGTGLFVVSPDAAVGDAWERVDLEVDVDGPDMLVVAVRATPMSAGDCFLVDDALLVRQ